MREAPAGCRGGGGSDDSWRSPLGFRIGDGSGGNVGLGLRQPAEIRADLGDGDLVPRVEGLVLDEQAIFGNIGGVYLVTVYQYATGGGKALAVDEKPSGGAFGDAVDREGVKPHDGLSRRKGKRAAEGKGVAVQHIVACCLENGEILGALGISLMDLVDKTRVNVQLFKHERGELIRLNIAGGFLQGQIAPDHVFGGIQIARFQPIFRDFDGGQVVAVQHQHHVLAKVLEGGLEGTDEGVHFTELVDIIGESVGPRLVGGTRKGDGRLTVVDRDLGIAAVSLDRDGKDKVLSLGGAERLQNIVGKDRVLFPRQLGVADADHMLGGGKGVEAEIGIDEIAVIEGARMVVHTVGGVAERGEVVRYRLTAVIAENALIGVLARAEEAEVKSRQHLELGVGGTAAEGGDREKSAGALLSEGGKVGDGVFRIGNVKEAIDVKEGLQLHQDNVRRVGGKVVFAGGELCCQRAKLLLGVVLWLVNSALKDASKEAVGEAVDVVCLLDALVAAGIGVGKTDDTEGDQKKRQQATDDGQEHTDKVDLRAGAPYK